MSRASPKSPIFTTCPWSVSEIKQFLAAKSLNSSSHITMLIVTDILSNFSTAKPWIAVLYYITYMAANWCRCCKFSVNLSSTIKTFFIPAIISWYNLLTVTSPNQWSLQWLCRLGHFKNWLIDWLIDTIYNPDKNQLWGNTTRYGIY